LPFLLMICTALRSGRPLDLGLGAAQTEVV
jgi:hypothetical protein